MSARDTERERKERKASVTGDAVPTINIMMMMIISCRNSPLEVNDLQPTAGLTSTCPQSKMIGHSSQAIN